MYVPGAVMDSRERLITFMADYDDGVWRFHGDAGQRRAFARGLLDAMLTTDPASVHLEGECPAAELAATGARYYGELIQRRADLAVTVEALRRIKDSDVAGTCWSEVAEQALTHITDQAGTGRVEEEGN